MFDGGLSVMIFRCLTELYEYNEKHTVNIQNDQHADAGLWVGFNLIKRFQRLHLHVLHFEIFLLSQ